MMFGVWSFPHFFGLEKVNKKLVDIHDHPRLFFNGDKLRCHSIRVTFLFSFFIPWKSLPPLVNLLDDKALQKWWLVNQPLRYGAWTSRDIQGDFGGITGGIQPLSPVSSSQWMYSGNSCINVFKSKVAFFLVCQSCFGHTAVFPKFVFFNLASGNIYTYIRDSCFCFGHFFRG